MLKHYIVIHPVPIFLEVFLLTLAYEKLPYPTSIIGAGKRRAWKSLFYTFKLTQIFGLQIYAGITEKLSLVDDAL